MSEFATSGSAEALPHLPGGTVTFLFTDIQGSTRLLEQLREQYATVLADQRDLLRAAFLAHNGTEIDTQGDSFFVAFPRALDAVACVADCQRALAEHVWPHGAQVRVRMGLHTGEPLLARTGYVGMDVNRAARIAASGHGGQVLLSQTTRDLVWQDLPAGLALRPLGEHKLKDIRYPQPIFQLDIAGLPADFPALKTASTEAPPTPGEPPFKGLQYFSEADADLFFGREGLTAGLVQAVCDADRTGRFLAVVGASGSGKSSLVRAGLVPALRRGGRLRGASESLCTEVAWQVFVLTPTAHPLEALATALTVPSESLASAASLMDDLSRDTRSLHLWAQRRLRLAERGARSLGTERLLLVIDQFEETFTLCRDEDERRAFIGNLLFAASADGGATSVLLTLRADFYQHLAAYPALSQAVARRQEYIGAMNADELRQAIEAPAAAGGWEFSPGLVNLLLHDIGAGPDRQPEPGALPLLSHALLETWKNRRANLMNLRAYHESGGVRGAIARTAEGVFQRELSPEQQAIARAIFLRLTELGEGTQDTRRRVAYNELFPPAPGASTEQIKAVITRLADARLITTDERTVEVAHEALIREWPTLREWLNADREGLRLHRHLTEAAGEWARLGRDPGDLYHGARLAQADEWAGAHPGQLNALEHDFLAASQAEAEHQAAEREARQQRELDAARQLAQEQARRAEEQVASSNRLRLRNRLLTAAGAAALVLALAASAFALQASSNARHAASQQSTAVAERERADLQAAAALQAEATAEADRDRADMQADLALRAEATAEADRDRAEQAAAESFSRELAVQSSVNLTVDPERSVLLALAAQQAAPLPEAFSALQAATLASRVVWRADPQAGWLLDVAFTPDGQHLVTGGEDGKARIWDAATGQEVRAMEGHTAPIEVLDLTRDGQRLATASDDGMVRVWDLASGAPTWTVNHEAGEQSVAFSPNGEQVAVASLGAAAVLIYDTQAGELAGILSHPDWPATAPAAIFPTGAVYSPDGARLAVALYDGIGADGQVEVWNVATGERLLVLPERFGIYRDGLDFSPDGTRLATGWSAAGPSTVWDALTGERLFSLNEGANRIQYSADGQRLLTATGGARADVWDAATGQSLVALRGHASLVVSVAESPECAGPPLQPFEWCGRWLASVSGDGTLRLWDVSPMGAGVPLTVPGGGMHGDQALSDGGRRLNTLLMAAPQRGAWLFQQWLLPDAPGGPLTDYASHIVRPEPGLIYVTGGPGREQAGRGHILLYETGRLHALDPAGATLADICCIDLPVISIYLSGDSSRLVLRRPAGVVEVWDTAQASQLSRIQVPKLAEVESEAMAVNHNGTRAAFVLADGLAVLDPATGDLLLEGVAIAHSPALLDLVFTRHDDAIFVLDCSGGLTIYDLASGQPRLSLSHSGGCFLGADISPDGAHVAASTVGGPLKVWDAATGALQFDLVGLPVISRGRFSPDGRLLYATTFDNLAPFGRVVTRAYFTRPDDLVAFARSRLTRGFTEAECQQYLHMETCPEGDN